MSYQNLGNWPIIQATRKKRTSTSVPIGGGGALIAADNPARIGLIIWNQSANSIYIEYNSTASSATPEHIIATFQSLVLLGPVIWTGPISAVRNAGSGPAVVTELLL